MASSWVEGDVVVGAPGVDELLAVVEFFECVGCAGVEFFEDGEVVGVFSVGEVGVVEGRVDVVEEDVPEARPEDRTLEHHVGESEGSGEGAVDEDGGGAGEEVIGEEIEEGVVEAGLLEFVDDECGVDVVEGASDVREENRDLLVMFEGEEPGVDEQGQEVLSGVVFAKGPLCVAVGVGVFEESEEGDGDEAFDGLGKDGGEVDAAVVVGVVGCAFFV